MSIKDRVNRKKFWIPVIIFGLFFSIVSTLVSYRIHTNTLEQSLVKTVNYIKVQCSTYTRFNDATETHELLRCIESNDQVTNRIDASKQLGIELTNETLEQYANEYWLHGILVLDENGEIEYSYISNKDIEDNLLQNFNLDTVLDYMNNTARSYSERISLADGSYISLASTARKDKHGVVLSYYYNPTSYARNYILTLQTLLEGYSTSSDGTMFVADDGYVVACNDSSFIGEKTEDISVLQTIKDHADSKHMIHIAENHSYGIMLRQRDHYIYAYVSDQSVISSVILNVLTLLFTYSCIIIILWALLQRSESEHHQLEEKKETEYKKELLEAAQKADAANIAKTQFLQRMSHDIRTPINGICGMLEVAEYYADDLDKQADCRAKIRDASNILLELINEVLDMGKLESGEVELLHEPFNLHEVLEEVIVVIEKLAIEQGIIVTQNDMDVTHWNLIGSEPHVKRLIMNILSNAVKYNKKNGSITISCHELPSTTKDQALIEFTCSDTGIGMSEEYQKKIYEPFTQENNGIHSKYGGTGLGMPIVKGLVTKMNGTITFDSIEGQGTTFVVTIPFEINTELDKKENENKPTYSIQGLNILLVEDNELNMEISEFALETSGAKITKAWNGKEAVDKFSSSQIHEYDVILMDVMMPVLTGYEATQIIRKLDRPDAKTIPIIAMTANAFSEDRKKSKEAGMDGHIAKPLDIDNVIETIDRLVHK